MGLVSFILRNLFYALIAFSGVVYIYVSYLDVIQSPNVDESLWNHNSKFEPTGKFNFVKIATNGIHLNVLEAGPKDGELLILLHGFPETALTSWYRFIGPFSSSGLHVVAPDMRGYNTSDKPIPVSEYHSSTVANDLVGVIEHFKAKKAILIGHDWGGVIAYQFALDHPEMVKKLVILNAPHPAAMQSKLTSPTQLRKSYYIFLFQVPGAMEGIMSRYGFAGLRTFMGQFSKIGKTFSSEVIPHYVQAWSEPYAIQAMIGYYRAAFRSIFTENPFSRKTQISAPTLILWGKGDLALEEDLATLSQQYIPDSRVVYFDDASHFVQHDVPEMVFEQISSFLK